MRFNGWLPAVSPCIILLETAERTESREVSTPEYLCYLCVLV